MTLLEQSDVGFFFLRFEEKEETVSLPGLKKVLTSFTPPYSFLVNIVQSPLTFKKSSLPVLNKNVEDPL